MVSIIELVFSLLYLPILFIIASYLFYKALKIKANNVIFLSAFFYLIAIDYLFVLIEVPQIIHSIITNTPSLFLILFVKCTFYKDKKSSFWVVLVSFLVLRIIDLILRVENNFMVPQVETIYDEKILLYYLFLTVVIFNSILVNGWFFYASFKTYRLIKSENISPWVKQRYLIVSLAMLSNIISISLNFFIPPNGGWYLGSIVALVIAIIKLPFVFLFIFGNLIGWIMPARLKSYFDRNYLVQDDADVNEDGLLKAIRKELASKISN